MQRLWNLPQRWGGWEPFRPKAGGQNGLRGPPPHCKPTVKFWEFPNQSAVLRQIFPDVSVRCRPWPVGGAAPGAERGKRGRAGGLSSHTREAATAEPESAAAAHLAPPAGRSGGAEEVVRSPGRDADAGEERQMTEQRQGWPSQSWSRCSTGSPNKHILVQGQRAGGCWPTPLPCPWPPCCSPVRRAAGQRLPWARVVMVLWPLPAAQRGKKNAEPAGREEAGSERREQTTPNSKGDRS
ncbi:uncharacterized protein [Sagmatias obliquidens]|uniref:uncharacterized protein isoform X2 n=1 Tax=Sagmatias obliquidens TaxID=3371155 RepID=UPI000F44418F|nr:uncharacterized protein LOC113607478 isoform X2 [Lagenorhynchus obliquidens]